MGLHRTADRAAAVTTQNAALVITGLTKEFPSGADRLHVLRGVDLQLARGEALAVTGPSGSGKSTLLYLIGTLDEPTSGRIEVLGENPFAKSPAERAKFRNAEVGFIFQEHHLLPQCTVLENVLLPTLAGTGAHAAEESRARGLLERVGLSNRISHLPAQLSGGERQRVAVCRALINQPVLLLADEPTGSLDRATAEAVGTLLLELSRELNTLTICVTHSLELAARFPKHMELLDGKLVPQTIAPCA